MNPVAKSTSDNHAGDKNAQTYLRQASGIFFSLVAILSDSIERCKIFRELPFFRCHTCSGRDGHRCKGGQQQNNLLRAVSLLHRVLVHSSGTVSYISFSLKTRRSRESEVPADFGDLNSVQTAAGIFCLLQAKPVVWPRGRHAVLPPALFFSQGHIMQGAGSEAENVFYLLPVSNLQQLLVWKTCEICKNCSSLHQKSNKVFY